MMVHVSTKIGYVIRRFPELPQTFILNEVLELERNEIPLEIFSLFEPLEEPRHGTLKEVRTPVTYLPHDSQPDWRIREERYAEGTFLQQPFKDLFRSESPPKILIPPTRMGRLISRLVKEVRGIEDLPIFAAKLKAVPWAATLAALARAKGVGHLHAHFGTESTTVAMLASKLSGLPYSFSAHAYDIYDQSRVNPVLLKEKIHLAQFVVTCTEYNRRTLSELAGRVAARKIIRVYHGVDVTRFRPDQSVQRERHLILAAGRLVEKKGFPYLLHACKILRERGRSFMCLIVGEGEERENLAGQINALGLRDLVGLPGARPQEQVLNLMKQATLFVLPCVVSDSGNRDGLPNALVEALAVGLPAISTTLSGIPELIEHGVNGLLVPPGDSVSLALAIEQMLMDPDLRERLARNGIKKVRECFDLRKNVKMFRNHLARSISVTPFSET